MCDGGWFGSKHDLGQGGNKTSRCVSGGLSMDQLSNPGISHVSSKQSFDQQSCNLFSFFVSNV